MGISMLRNRRHTQCLPFIHGHKTHNVILLAQYFTNQGEKNCHPTEINRVVLLNCLSQSKPCAML